MPLSEEQAESAASFQLPASWPESLLAVAAIQTETSDNSSSNPSVFKTKYMDTVVTCEPAPESLDGDYNAGWSLSRLSCPYRKRNPQRFNIRDYSACVTPVFRNSYDVM
jgi:hypothetical protein